MLTNDNLYRSFVPDHRKNKSLVEFYANREKTPPALPSWAFLRDGKEDKAEHAVLILMEEYLRAGCNFTLLDVGAFNGDFAVRTADIAKKSGVWFKSICFDPTFAGALIEHNITLNQLEDFITFEDIAIATVDGPQMIAQHLGHADSAAIEIGAPTHQFRYVVPGIKLSNYIRKNRLAGTDLIFKIDIEGLDWAIINDVTSNFGHRNAIIFEYAPANWMRQQINMVAFLDTMAASYNLFDLHYLPYPSRARLVTREQVRDFTIEVSQRQWGYTDVMCVPKDLPFADALTARLATLKERAPSYNLID